MAVSACLGWRKLLLLFELALLLQDSGWLFTSAAVPAVILQSGSVYSSFPNTVHIENTTEFVSQGSTTPDPLPPAGQGSPDRVTFREGAHLVIDLAAMAAVALANSGSSGNFTPQTISVRIQGTDFLQGSMLCITATEEGLAQLDVQRKTLYSTATALSGSMSVDQLRLRKIVIAIVNCSFDDSSVIVSNFSVSSLFSPLDTSTSLSSSTDDLLLTIPGGGTTGQTPLLSFSLSMVGCKFTKVLAPVGNPTAGGNYSWTYPFQPLPTPKESWATLPVAQILLSNVSFSGGLKSAPGGAATSIDLVSSIVQISNCNVTCNPSVTATGGGGTSGTVGEPYCINFLFMADPSPTLPARPTFSGATSQLVMRSNTFFARNTFSAYLVLPSYNPHNIALSGIGFQPGGNLNFTNGAKWIVEDNVMSSIGTKNNARFMTVGTSFNVILTGEGSAWTFTRNKINLVAWANQDVSSVLYLAPSSSLIADEKADWGWFANQVDIRGLDSPPGSLAFLRLLSGATVSITRSSNWTLTGNTLTCNSMITPFTQYHPLYFLRLGGGTLQVLEGSSFTVSRDSWTMLSDGGVYPFWIGGSSIVSVDGNSTIRFDSSSFDLKSNYDAVVFWKWMEEAGSKLLQISKGSLLSFRNCSIDMESIYLQSDVSLFRIWGANSDLALENGSAIAILSCNVSLRGMGVALLIAGPFARVLVRFNSWFLTTNTTMQLTGTNLVTFAYLNGGKFLVNDASTVSLSTNNLNFQSTSQSAALFRFETSGAEFLCEENSTISLLSNQMNFTGSTGSHLFRFLSVMMRIFSNSSLILAFNNITLRASSDIHGMFMHETGSTILITGSSLWLFKANNMQMPSQSNGGVYAIYCFTSHLEVYQGSELAFLGNTWTLSSTGETVFLMISSASLLVDGGSRLLMDEQESVSVVGPRLTGGLLITTGELKITNNSTMLVKNSTWNIESSQNSYLAAFYHGLNTLFLVSFGSRWILEGNVFNIQANSDSVFWLRASKSFTLDLGVLDYATMLPLDSAVTLAGNNVTMQSTASGSPTGPCGTWFWDAASFGATSPGYFSFYNNRIYCLNMPVLSGTRWGATIAQFLPTTPLVYLSCNTLNDDAYTFDVKAAWLAEQNDTASQCFTCKPSFSCQLGWNTGLQPGAPENSLVLNSGPQTVADRCQCQCDSRITPPTLFAGTIPRVLDSQCWPTATSWRGQTWIGGNLSVPSWITVRANAAPSKPPRKHTNTSTSSPTRSPPTQTASLSKSPTPSLTRQNRTEDTRNTTTAPPNTTAPSNETLAPNSTRQRTATVLTLSQTKARAPTRSVTSTFVFPNVERVKLRIGGSGGAVATVLDPQTATTLVSTATTASVVGGFFNPTLATQAVRLGTVTNVINCAFSTNEDDLEPGYLDYPLQMAVGSGIFALYSGSAFLSAVGLIGSSTLLLTVVYFIGRRCDQPKLGSDETGSGSGAATKAKAVIRWLQANLLSTAFFTFFSYIGPSQFRVLTLIIAHNKHSVPSDFGLVVASSVMVIVLFVLLLIFLIWAFPKWVQPNCSASQEEDDKKKNPPNLDPSLEEPLLEGGTVPAGPNGEAGAASCVKVQNRRPPTRTLELHEREEPFYNASRGSYVVETFAPCFDASRNHAESVVIRLFFMEEVFVSSLLMALDGIRPRKGNCEKIAVAMCVVTVLHLLYLTLVRPYKQLIELFCAGVGAVLLLAVSIVVTIITYKQMDGAALADTDPAMLALGYLSVIENAFFFVQAVILAIAGYMHSQEKAVLRRWRKMEAENQEMQSPTHRTKKVVEQESRILAAVPEWMNSTPAAIGASPLSQSEILTQYNPLLTGHRR